MKVTIDTSLHMPWVEQIILSVTLGELEQELYRVYAVQDSEEYTAVESVDEALREASGIDDFITIRLKTPKGEDSWIQYIPGNGLDCISDYHINLGDIPLHIYNAIVDHHLKV